MHAGLRIVAFEPYDSGSHAAVRRSISLHSRHAWTWITRPGRGFKWRMRLAALEMVDMARREGSLAERPDAIFATSLMSASDLRATLPAACRNVPLVLYMHENQAVYPAGHVTPGAGDRDVHFALTNLASVLAADRVAWNSAYNRDSFLAAAADLIRKAPDLALGDWAERVQERSVVIWPPVEIAPGPAEEGRILHNPIRVVWPHRWERDKGPDELLDFAVRHSETLNLRWVILGPRFRQVPAALREFQARLAGRIDHFGFAADRAAYAIWLRRCDWVLSTAQHEFFGIAVVEAMLSGCLPWLPDRLSYPEILPEIARGLSPAHPPADPGAVRAAIRTHLAPALAPAAVARIDALIDDAIAAPDPPVATRR